MGKELTAIETRLTNLGSEAEQWQDIIEKAMDFASRCGKAYRQANDRGRRVLNKASFESLEIRDGKIAQ